jgi:16S rRNA (uracil1498-N3)-methyltransferase
MRIPRFFESAELAPNQSWVLSDEVTQHVARVLRMRVGDTLILFNGSGSEFECELTQVEKRSATVTVKSQTDISRASPLHVHIGQALSRGERMDYAVQKATETGMSEMTPLTTERSEVRLKEDRQDKRLRHWQQVAISACEQSLRNELPTIHPVSSLEEWITSVEADLKLVLHHHSAKPLADFDQPTSVALLIGPEGGLTEAEVELAQQQGFQPVAFGPRVFRTETAPVAALSILQYLWGDFA